MSFKLLLDFGATGLYTASGSDVTDRVRIVTALNWSRGNDQIREFAPPAAGDLAAELDNHDGAFSPGNMSSPLYGLITPGKIMARLLKASGAGVGALLESGGGILLESGDDLLLEDSPSRVIWTGPLDDVGQHPEFDNRSVVISALGSMSRLRGKKISTGLYKDISTSDALGVVLDEAGWPATDRNIQSGNIIMPWWWYPGDAGDAFDAAYQLKQTEGVQAGLYEDGAGKIVFENSTARTTQTRSTVSQAVWSDTTNLLAPLDYSPNYKDVIIAASMTQQDREAQALAVIWTYGGTLTLAPGEVRKLPVSGSDPFMGALVPSPVGRNAEQVLVASAPLTSGTYKANLNGTLTGDINYNDDAATTQAAFEAAVGSGNVQCGGTLATGLRVQFCGALAEKEIPLITIESSLNPGVKHATIRVLDITDGPDSTYKLYVDAPLSAGQFKIKSYLGVKTAFLGYNITAGHIQTALELEPLIFPGDCPASGGPMNTDPVTIPFTGTLSGSSVSLEITDDSTLMTATAPTATILVTETVKGGGPDYLLISGDVTFDLDRDNGASAMLECMAGPLGASFNGLQVRGRPVIVVRTNEVIYPTGALGPEAQIYKPNVRPEIAFDDAVRSMTAYSNHYKDPRPTLLAAIMPIAIKDSAVDSYLVREISDRVTIASAHMQINEDYFIERIAGTIIMKVLYLVFGLERAI